MIRKIVLGLTLAAFACTGAAFAQGIKRTPLQKIDFPAGYTTVTAIAEIPAGGSAGRHTHPGVETGYVIEGEGDRIIDGQPTKQSWDIPAGAIHDAKVTGDKPLKIMAIYIVEKDKPLATPAP
jgi:mannose-6-phosphate isomerase-like protein (cupin superfamily)